MKADTVGITPRTTFVLEEQDDLFAPRPPAPLLHAITCAVCGTRWRIYVVAPGDLCDTCRADLPAMRAHVEDVVDRARSRLHVLIEQFDDAVARESAEDQARWQAVVRARVAAHNNVQAASILRSRLAATLALHDGLSRILQAHGELEKGCGEVEQQELWGVVALREIEVAS